MGIDDLLKSKRADILQVTARRGARNVRVFGSVARGEARPDKRYRDVLVELEAGRRWLRWTTAALNQTTQRYSAEAGIERGLWWLPYGGLTNTLTISGSATFTQTAINNLTVTIIITANASVTTTVIPPGQVTINQAVTPATFPGAGRPVTYTIMIANAGTGTVRVTQITDTLPTGFSYITTTTDIGAGSIVTNGQNITWTYTSADIGGGNTATLTFQALASGSFTLTQYCNNAGAIVSGLGISIADSACVGRPEYFITAQAGSQTIRARVRLAAGGWPTILSWEFLP